MVPGPIIIIVISVVVIMCAVRAETRRDCRSRRHRYEIGFYTTPGEANAFVSADRECHRQLKNHIHKQIANSAAASNRIPVWGTTLLQSSLTSRTVHLILILNHEQYIIIYAIIYFIILLKAKMFMSYNRLRRYISSGYLRTRGEDFSYDDKTIILL